MKRVLAFLLLFGAGVALLWRLEEQFARENVVAPPAPPVDRTLVGAPERIDDEGVQWGGRFEVLLYDERTSRLTLRVESEDSATGQGHDLLRGVEVQVFDPDRDGPEAPAEAGPRGVITATSARLPRGSASALRPQHQKRVLLEDVEGLLLDALSGTPLEFETPAGVVDATDPEHVTFEADERILLRSLEFEAGGSGYHLDVVRPRPQAGVTPHGAEDVIELRRGGWLMFQRAAEEDASGIASGRFEATGDGPLQIRREGEVGPRPIRFEVWQGGRLSLSGARTSTLEGTHILLRGTALESAEAVRPEVVEVDGGAVWTSGPNVFQGRTCRLDFDDQGLLSRALLEGLPRAHIEVALKPSDAAELPASVGEEVVFDVRSDRSIEVRQGRAVISYVVAGQARVETEGVTLRSNGDLIGQATLDGDAVSFQGTGGVVVEAAEGTLEAGEFELRMRYDEDGRQVVTGTATGGARLVRALPDGRVFVVSTPSRLEVERIGGELQVVEGDSVELSVSEPNEQGDLGLELFFARCDRLIGLELVGRTFLAEGNVLYRSEGRTATGARLNAYGEGRFRLWGGDDVRAEVVTPIGRALAEEIELDGDRLHARGAVEASISSLPPDAPLPDGVEFDRYDLFCDDLLVTTERERLDDGTVLERLTASAAGRVVSTLVTSGRTLELRHADRLDVTRVGHRASGASDARHLGSTTELTATGGVAAHVSFLSAGAERVVLPQHAHRPRQEISELTVFCDTLDVTRQVAEEGATDPSLALLAQGNVRFEGSSEVDFHGEGDRLRIDPDQTAHLEAPEAGRVRLFGVLPTHGLPFELTAERADFSSERIEALEPEIVVTRAASPASGVDQALHYRARAKRLVAGPRSLEFYDQVRLHGATKRGVPWTLDAKRIVLEGTPGRTADEPAELSKISATGGIVFRLEPGVVARAEALFGVRPTGVLRITGNPATIESPTMPTVTADWMDFDPELQIILEAGRGGIESRGDANAVRRAGGNGGQGGAGQDPEPQDARADEQDAFRIGWEWQTTRVDGDSLVWCMQQPVLEYPGRDTSLRASWVVIWIDRDQWQNLSADERQQRAQAVQVERSTAELGPMRMFFDFLERRGVSGLVQEAYFEGPVEIYAGQEQVAYCDAAYFDLASGHGWLANATVHIVGALVGQEFDRVTIKADWLRHSRDGSLRASDATVTPCSFEEPHVRIVTGDLRLTPLSNEVGGGFELVCSDNRIEMYDLPRIPLPSIGVDTDETLKPQLPSLRFGNSARFGQLFAFKFSRPARQLGGWFHDLFSFDEDDEPDGGEEPGTTGGTEEEAAQRERRRRNSFDARYDFDASYLGSRGGLFDLGFTIRERSDRYWFDFLTGVVLDDGEDRGYLRVPEAERDQTRLWLRSHGWLDLGDHRFSLAFSDQSDPGVQAEFFEREFERYEESESYLQWKRTRGHTFAQASAKLRVDSFRSDVEELPAVTLFSGRAPIARLGGLPVVHTGELSAGYLRRRGASRFDLNGDGFDDAPITSPFRGDGTFADPNDPVGDRDVLRADLVQRLELPLSLGAAGLRLVPFVSARGTGWSRAVGDEDATRTVLEGGARLTTTLWRTRGDAQDQVTPYVGYRAEVDSDAEGTPYVFDDTERALFGDFVEVGTRARLGVREERSRLDLDLRGVYAADRSDGMPDGWLPLEVFGRLALEPVGRVFDVWYDGRYDAEQGEAVYSLFSLGTRLGDDAGLQVGHQFGRDDALVKTFDAATVAGFYRWTDKWEFEAQQTLSLLGDQRLGTSFLVRRYGHDVVFEIESDFREGEGTSVNFNLRPRLGYRPSRIGYINW